MNFLRTFFGAPAPVNTAELIEQIHTEFNTAGGRLLEQAQALLADGATEFKVNKAERLNRFGFGNTQEAKANAALATEAAQAKELQGLIMDYALRYPTNRFITRAQVDVIAAKYNLVVGDVSAYTGFVPDVKLREVEAFSARLQERDVIEDSVRIKRWLYLSVQGDEVKRLRVEYPDDIFPASMVRISPSTACVVKESQTTFFDKFERIKGSAMLIAAPAKDMNVVNMQKVKGHFFSFTEHEVPDPVVLQPVKGGYLIVTAWGDEASDPLVANSQNN